MKTDILKQPWLAQSNYIVFLLNISMPTCPQKTRKWDFKALLLVGEKNSSRNWIHCNNFVLQVFPQTDEIWNK